ncbi:MAG TPA: di-heme oxidoredictase family protein, partial [Polyangiaceae bacterium]|nr:di-heme oxidoredictase family protein [Polyangiaceae bacterium]
SGRASYLQDAQTGDMRVGRFGWKAEVASVEQEAARASAADLGVGNSLFPDSAGSIELVDDELSDLVTYLRLIGVPPQRNASETEVAQGEQLFTAVGCAACHLSTLLTGPDHPFAELRSQTIRPFTDLLLHDMGEDLADDSGVLPQNSSSAPAYAAEWRTPPLWGLGLATTVNSNARLLHDGRAATILEAILWHGGEAIPSIDHFKALTKPDRDALLAFLGSL